MERLQINGAAYNDYQITELLLKDKLDITDEVVAFIVNQSNQQYWIKLIPHSDFWFNTLKDLHYDEPWLTSLFHAAPQYMIYYKNQVTKWQIKWLFLNGDASSVMFEILNDEHLTELLNQVDFTLDELVGICTKNRKLLDYDSFAQARELLGYVTPVAEVNFIKQVISYFVNIVKQFKYHTTWFIDRLGKLN